MATSKYTPIENTNNRYTPIAPASYNPNISTNPFKDLVNTIQTNSQPLIPNPPAVKVASPATGTVKVADVPNNQTIKVIGAQPTPTIEDKIANYFEPTPNLRARDVAREVYNHVSNALPAYSLLGQNSPNAIAQREKMKPYNDRMKTNLDNGRDPLYGFSDEEKKFLKEESQKVIGDLGINVGMMSAGTSNAVDDAAKEISNIIERTKLKEGEINFGDNVAQPNELSDPLFKGSTPYDPRTTKNKVELPIAGTTDKQKVKSVINNAERIKNELMTRGQDAYVAGQKLSPSDIKLAEQYDAGVPVADLVEQAKNPSKFKVFMNKMTDYYDFRLAADRAAGGDTAQVQNYIPHQWNLSNPEDLAKFNDLAKQKGLQPYNGFRSQPRVFSSYAEGESKGFTRANPNILGDLKSDYERASHVISSQTLKQGLQQTVPDKVNMSGFGLTDRGKPFLNSNAQGLEGLSIHPDIANMFKGYEKLTNKDFIKMAQDEAKFAGAPGLKGTLKAIPASAKEAGLGGMVGTLYDHANQPLKHLILNLSGFHSINISANFAGASLTHPISAIRGLVESIPSFLSETVTQKVIDGFKSKMIPETDMSVFDAGLRAGVNMDRGLPATHTWLNVHPMQSLSRAIFDRELYTLKLNLVDQVFGNGKIAPESVKGQNLGKEINMIMGELNNHTMNINPNTSKWLSRALLAPQFTTSKYKVIGDAATQWGKEDAGSLARKAVIGKSIVVGTMATLGTLLATGNFPNLHQIFLNYTTNPSTQTNLKNTKGKPLDVGYPKTFIDEPLGLVQDPGQYLRSRLAPALSDLYEAAPPSVIGTGKNYYGSPIYNPKSKTPWLTQEIGNTVANDLPIGVQNFLNQARGTQTGAQTLIGVGGLSTHVKTKSETAKKSRYTPL